MDLQTIFLLFIFYSFFGWLFETSFVALVQGKIFNRGFLIGPWCPLYGYSAILVTLLLQKYYSDPLIMFVMAAIICTILEYIVSYVMEKIFKARWWDYTGQSFNINGRVRLVNMIPFGLLCLIVMYVFNPLMIVITHITPALLLNIITAILAMLFILDTLVSFKLANDLKHINFTKKTDNTDEIRKLIQKTIKSKKKELSLLKRRILHAYPNLIKEKKKKS